MEPLQCRTAKMLVYRKKALGPNLLLNLDHLCNKTTGQSAFLPVTLSTFFDQETGLPPHWGP